MNDTQSIIQSVLSTASERWMLVYEEANTVAEKTFHPLHSLFLGNRAEATRVECSHPPA
jgi:hypothetical protein